jgi:hypothetical protein
MSTSPGLQRLYDRASQGEGGFSNIGPAKDFINGYRLFAAKHKIKVHCKDSRDYKVWVKVRTGVITHHDTLRAIAQDKALEKKFIAWDLEAKKFLSDNKLANDANPPV